MRFNNNPLETRPFTKLWWGKIARKSMIAHGFSPDWVEGYVRTIGDRIDSANTEEEAMEIFEELNRWLSSALKSPQPVAWVGA